MYATGVNDDSVLVHPRSSHRSLVLWLGASGANYTLTEADLGKSISVIASYTDGGSFEHNITSSETSIIQPPSYTPLTDANFQTAVNLWFSDEANATATYGHIKDWNTSAVTDMTDVFKDRTTFNENIMIGYIISGY